MYILTCTELKYVFMQKRLNIHSIPPYSVVSSQMGGRNEAESIHSMPSQTREIPVWRDVLWPNQYLFEHVLARRAGIWIPFFFHFGWLTRTSHRAATRSPPRREPPPPWTGNALSRSADSDGEQQSEYHPLESPVNAASWDVNAEALWVIRRDHLKLSISQMWVILPTWKVFMPTMFFIKFYVLRSPSSIRGNSIDDVWPD